MGRYKSLKIILALVLLVIIIAMIVVYGNSQRSKFNNQSTSPAPTVVDNNSTTNKPASDATGSESAKSNVSPSGSQENTGPKATAPVTAQNPQASMPATGEDLQLVGPIGLGIVTGLYARSRKRVKNIKKLYNKV